MKKLALPILMLMVISLLVQKKSFAQEGTKITQTTLVETKVNSVLHNSCHGDKKGAINIMVSGGVPPYKYQWSNGATTQDIAGLAAGEYTVFVIDSYDCPDTLTVEVKEPPKLTLQVDGVKDILCFGYQNGEVDVTVEGGVPPYVYSWSNQSNSEDLRGVEAGEYALMVTDANHCQEITSAFVKQNPLIVRSNEKVQNVDCAGDSTGTIDIDVKGGVPPYNYRWTSGQTSEDLVGLTAGRYTVMVTDSRGCNEAYATKVTEPDAIEIELKDVNHINCFGDESGSINIKVKGGESPYKYTWNDSLAFTQDLAGLAAGEYNLVVEDIKGCRKYLSQEINEPEELVVTIDDVKNVLNYGGTDGAVYISVAGGVEPYKYRWSNGARSEDVANLPSNNYTCRILDDNRCVNTISVNITQPALLEVKIDKLENIKCFNETTGLIDVDVKGGVAPYKYAWSNGDTTKNISNLAAGTYNLSVTDANGVVKTLKGTIEQPTLLEASVQSVSNIACYGDNEGIIDINVEGGTAPYRYNWSNGARSQDIKDVPAGRYTVQVIDRNQCTDSLNITIEQSPLLSVQPMEVKDINCYGTAEGSINVEVTGGVAPYKFNWSNGEETRNLSGLKAGPYSLKVTDEMGCSQTMDARITEPTLLQTSVASIIDVKCKGDSTGAINLNVSGGTAPYFYEWSDGNDRMNNTLIKAGSYNVQITDSKGCINNLSATVEEPSELAVALDNVINIDCYGDNSGAVYVSVGGGVAPYIYNWSNGATTQNILGVVAGDYGLNVKDQNGCVTEVTTTITQNTDLVASVQELTHVNCFDFETGAAVIGVTGGVEPYAYKWSNGVETKDLSEVKAGNYTISVTDSRGCLEPLDVVIEQPADFIGEITSITEIGCHGDSNAVVLTAFQGGVAPYEFQWNTGQTTKDIMNLKAGTYSLRATDSNGCIEELSTVIEQPTKLELDLISVTNNLCYGERAGAIDISVKGGVTPYTYTWNNGAESQDQDMLEAGKYFVTVTGATGCQKYLDTEITQPDPLELRIVSTTNVNCNGGNNGAVDLEVTGGVEPYIYSWSNGETTQDIENIVAGSYTVNVVDANGCVNNVSALISQPDPLVATIADVKDILCHGDATGAISIDVVGGTQPYTYAWSNGATTEDIDGLVVGDYSVDITDANGCTQRLEATITEPEIFASEIVATEDVLCNGIQEGSIDISVTGGVTPYIYTWSNGSNEQDISNIGAGTYEVKIEDANGCVQNLSAVINEPSMLVVSIADISNIREYGKKNGSISISVNGGTSPYEYSWSNGETSQNISELVAGNYSVIVHDANGCRQDVNANISQPAEIKITVDSINHIRCYGEQTGYARTTAIGGVPPYMYVWSSGDSTSYITDMYSGDYTLTVTDANGATKVEKVRIEQPEYFELEIGEVKHPTCFELNNGMIKTIVKGGTTPYMFNWNTGDATKDLKGLTSGMYTIRVSDSRGCTQIDSVELTKPDALEVELVGTENILCQGEQTGSVDIDVRGGTPPYKFNWNHGAVDQNLSGIMAGNYSVKVTDENGCVQSVSTTITEPPLLVTGFASISHVPCEGENAGIITTSVTGGVPPYKYQWSNGDSTANIQNLTAGDYNVRINDANGCSGRLFTEITEPTRLTGSVNYVNDINCHGDNEGAIGITVEGGTPPYRYEWSNGSTDKNLTGIIAGQYNVKVIDSQGCEIVLEAEVKEPTELIANVSAVENINCFGDLTGSINVNVQGGIEPYAYTWSNGATTQDLLNIAAGNYTLLVKDSRGCNTTVNTTVEEPQPLEVRNTAINNIQCSGGQEGAVTISVTGGQEPYAFNWSNGATTRDIQNVPAGTYKLDVTDANGCTQSTTAFITEPPVLTAAIDAVKHISCNGQSNGEVNLSISGGTVPYSYQWSNGAISQDLLNVSAGNYSVLIKEGNGCETTLDVEVTEPPMFVSELLSVEHNNCFADENGSITISAEGGTEPYTFEWSNGASTQNLENLVAGDYAVLVSDANGCNRTIKAEINEPPRLVLKIDSARNVKCCGDTSGAIFISVNGGVPPYDYTWSHGAKSQDVTGLVEGQYTVTITDANNCIVNTPEEGATIYEKIIAQGKFISRDILFDLGKATIKEESFIEISRIASFMKEHPQVRFSIEGHTDSQGSEEVNQRLSEQRATSIKNALVQFGIQEHRMEVVGKGEAEPIDTNATPEGRANNRRVEFIPL